MSEQELNAYRFSSGKEPTDEMLSQIMREVRTDAMERRRKSDLKYHNEMEKQRTALKAYWNDRLKHYTNGQS